MRIHLFWTVTLLLIVGSCTVVSPPGPTATPEIPPKQPEPSRPLVGGEISGLPDGTIVTIHICTPKAEKPILLEVHLLAPGKRL